MVHWRVNRNVCVTMVCHSACKYQQIRRQFPARTHQNLHISRYHIFLNGYFNQTQRVLCDQASKALFSMLKSTNRFVNLNPGTTMDVFDKLITPVLCYAAEVWGFHAGPDIERLHLKFSKQVLGVKRCTQNDLCMVNWAEFP